MKVVPDRMVLVKLVPRVRRVYIYIYTNIKYSVCSIYMEGESHLVTELRCIWHFHFKSPYSSEPEKRKGVIYRRMPRTLGLCPTKNFDPMR